MLMHWKEASKDQYEAAQKKVGWKTNVPDGAWLHVCTFTDDGMHVLDIWESPEDFQKFMDTRLGPAIQEVGIQGQPVVSISPLHATFNTPAYKPR